MHSTRTDHPGIVYVASKHVPPGIADQFEHGRRRCAVARSAPPVSLLECVCVCVCLSIHLVIASVFPISAGRETRAAANAHGRAVFVVVVVVVVTIIMIIIILCSLGRFPVAFVPTQASGVAARSAYQRKRASAEKAHWRRYSKGPVDAASDARQAHDINSCTRYASASPLPDSSERRCLEHSPPLSLRPSTGRRNCCIWSVDGASQRFPLGGTPRKVERFQTAAPVRYSGCRTANGLDALPGIRSG